MKPNPYTPTLSFVCILSFFLITGCTKELSLEAGEAPPPLLTKEQQLQALLSESSFQLKGFYSDIPVDYIQTDAQVKQETDLWGYVAAYLKDDVYSFTDNGVDVQVDQHALLMPGSTVQVLNKQYATGTDENGVYFTFLDYLYRPLTYRLYDVKDNYFILSIEWEQGATLFSRYERVP